MSEKRKRGFWIWVLLEGPLSFLKAAKREITIVPYGWLMVIGVFSFLFGLTVVFPIFGYFCAVVVMLVSWVFIAYAYYKAFEC